jgi:hypothetical protein
VAHLGSLWVLVANPTSFSGSTISRSEGNLVLLAVCNGFEELELIDRTSVISTSQDPIAYLNRRVLWVKKNGFTHLLPSKIIRNQTRYTLLYLASHTERGDCW